MNTSLPVCSLYVNTTCWKEGVDKMNKDFARLMLPVQVMMGLFMSSGVIGNALVLIVYTFKQNKTSAHILIINLAGIDLFACTVIHPYIIYKIVYFYDQTWEEACKVFEFLVHFNLCASGITLFVVAIDRYLAICKPVKFLRFDPHVNKVVIATIVLSVCLSLPLIEFYGKNPNLHDVASVTIVTYRCDFSESYQGHSSMFAFSALIMSLFLIQVVLMSVLYEKVAVTAYRSRRAVVPLSTAHTLAGIKPKDTVPGSAVEMAARSGNSNAAGSSMATTSVTINSSPPTEKEAKINTTQSREAIFCVNKGQTSFQNLPLVRYRTAVNNQSERKLFSSKLKAAKILFLVTAVFFLSWMPFFIMRICSTLRSDYWVRDTDFELVLENLLNHFFYINNAANPIIYTIINKNFRAECKIVLKKQFRCQ